VPTARACELPVLPVDYAIWQRLYYTAVKGARLVHVR